MVFIIFECCFKVTSTTSKDTPNSTTISKSQVGNAFVSFHVEGNSGVDLVNFTSELRDGIIHQSLLQGQFLYSW